MSWIIIKKKAHCGKSLIVLFHQMLQTRHSYTKDLKVVADEFKVFFSSVGRNAAHAAACFAEENKITLSEPPFDSHIPASEELFNWKPETCGDVWRIIFKIPLNKSPGPDKFNAGVIKDCLPVILGLLTEIINRWFPLSRNFYVRRWVQFTFANKIEAMHERSHVSQ